MTDITKLKALAEAAAEQQKQWEDAGRPWPIWNSCMYEMHSAANPAAVLELIAEIERQAAQFKEWQASHHANYCAVADERDQLKAENDALRKDAERYRWFRNQHWDSSAICAVVDPKQSTTLGAYCPSGKLLDDAIDAGLAMSKGEQP